MSEKARAILKAYFNTGDKPSEAEFANLIDSMSNFSDDFATKFAKKLLSSADLLSSNTTPPEIIVVPGAGKILIPQLIIARTNYGTITYATNTTLQLMWDSTTQALDTMNLARAEDYIEMFNDVSAGSNLGVLANYENKNLTLKTLTGNPTAGDGTMDIFLWYRILTL